MLVENDSFLAGQLRDVGRHIQVVRVIVEADVVKTQICEKTIRWTERVKTCVGNDASCREEVVRGRYTYRPAKSLSGLAFVR